MLLPRFRPRRMLLTIGLTAGALAAALVVAPGSAASPDRSLDVSVLSSPRPDKVSDGDALVRVAVPRDVSPASVRVWRDGTEVTGAFTADPGGASLTGLVGGLRDGVNTVLARAAGAMPGQLRVTNHPRTGPMLAGPHERPFVCGTATFRTRGGQLLGAPTDDDCSAPTRVEYVYRSTADAKLHPLPAERPADLATATTITGATVPYILRVETGVINRSIYEYAVLHDPAAGEPTYRQPPTGWNGRMIYTFGGGCPRGWYQQGSSTGGIDDDVMLSRGYAVASSSLNVFGQNCNGVLAAETMAMTREHVAETIGVPEHTIGWGCSGGSYQVLQIGDSYPGLLDGIIAACVFPEVGFATLHTITDALLLDTYFKATPGYTDAQKRAITGFGSVGSIPNLAGGGRRIDPRVYCPNQLPAGQRYHPETNPGGARCDVYDHQVNIWGLDPATNAARRPLDNVGIQYGLAALNSGAISADEFVDLNERVGGFDTDANVRPQRTVADRAAIDTAYRTGQLLNGGGGLSTTPIIDYREYTDALPNGDIHMRFHSFSLRERLTKANGDAANQVMLVESRGRGGFNTRNPLLADALAQMDAWLVSTAADQGPGSARDRMLRSKPAGLVDACWTAAGEKVAEPQVDGVGTTTCNTLFPSWPAPRQVAGAGVVNDVIACRLRPVSEADYKVAVTPAQLTRLRAVFPAGVCDWTAPGVGQRPPGASWPTF